MNSSRSFLFALTLIVCIQASLALSYYPHRTLNQDELKATALKLVSMRSRTQLDNLSIVHISTPNSLITNIEATTFTIVDSQTHTPYDITLDNSGYEISREDILVRENEAYTAKYGKLTPALAQALESIGIDGTVPVVIVIKDSAVGPDRPVQPFIDSQTYETLSDVEKKAFRDKEEAYQGSAKKVMLAKTCHLPPDCSGR